MSMSFEEASSKVKEWTAKPPSQDDQLELYGWFKQVKEGDVKGDRPGMFSMTARAKWDAWEKCKGTSADDAKKNYVAKVEKLKATCG
ncbi:unnamed protein product [Amoebophrya sp. A25]|nr:unnamed protein product [Amoebophrya sp. A25]|eukprot:GSA25T00027127001.1